MNISGVELIYTSKYIANYTWGWSWLALVPIALFVLSAIGIYCCINPSFDLGMFIYSALILVFSVVLGLFILHSGTPIYGTQYECTVEDNVNFNEIAKKYQIADIHGKLYTLRPYEIEPWTDEIGEPQL